MFQCELVFKRMGVEVVHISGGDANSHSNDRSNNHSKADDWVSNGFEPERSSENSPQDTHSPVASSSGAMTKLPTETQPLLHAILAQGHRLGIERVDKRRFQMNSWRSHTMLKDSSETEAADKLNDCLAQFPDHYVRLVSIDRQTKQRMSETIVQRPG